MCGIAGVIKKNAKTEVWEIKQMTDAISHRGPDGEGYFLFNNVGIGHRRLSIIDISTGAQPMCNEDEKIWITFNGEIYNFSVLKQELIQKGHSFKTHSDTEVILHAYEEWGEKCLTKLRGMFSFCIVDTKKQFLFLARDYIGIKPLVYYQDENVFAFASEIQSILSLDSVKPEIDLTAIDQYLWLQYIPTPNTIFKQIKKLRPGHYMKVGFNGVISEPVEYWNFDFKHKKYKSLKKWLEEANEVLADSVQSHLISDVPFGAFLSGGIDSTLVVGYMSSLLKNPVQTFTIGFEDKEYDETFYSSIASEKFNTKHTIDIVKPDALEVLPKLVKHYGEPFGDSSAIPTYYVCEAARKHVTMVLSGDGGDEFFGGYNSYLSWNMFCEKKHFQINPNWKEPLYPFMHFVAPWRYPKIIQPEDTLQNWLSFINYFSEKNLSSIWRPEYWNKVHRPLSVFEREFQTAAKYGITQKVQYMDIKTYLPSDILTKVDIASMIHSLEVRTPIIDINVMNFAASVPENINIERLGLNEWRGKLLLKKLLSPHFDNNFIYRQKMGFAVPISKWFGKAGEYNQYINDRLLGSGSLLHKYFDPLKIREVIYNESGGQIWLLLFLDEWFEQNKKYIN